MALRLVGGSLPVSVEELARRAHAYVINPLASPLKAALDTAPHDVNAAPPMLGIFSDTPAHQLRESDVHALARAGFTWLVADGEHSQNEGRYGRDQTAMLLRHGITPVQRLHREARSEHGDALCLGSRATMAPYGTTLRECDDYLNSMVYPRPGAATPLDRGGFPMRMGDRSMLFTPDALRAGESETQAFVQFETEEYICTPEVRDAVLERMLAQGPNKACGFIGPFDAVLRAGATEGMARACTELIETAAARGLHMGRVVGSGACATEAEIEEAMVEALGAGCRLVCVHYLTSDLSYVGAHAAARPFWRAVERCGLS